MQTYKLFLILLTFHFTIPAYNHYFAWDHIFVGKTRVFCGPFNCAKKCATLLNVQKKKIKNTILCQVHQSSLQHDMKKYGKPYGIPMIRFFISICFHPGHPMLHPGHVHSGRMGLPGSGYMLTLHLGHVQHYHHIL